MDRCKQIYAQPIATSYTVFLLQVFLPRRGKERYFLTVVDAKDDLKYCECLPDWVECKRRIKEIETEVLSA